MGPLGFFGSCIAILIIFSVFADQGGLANMSVNDASLLNSLTTDTSTTTATSTGIRPDYRERGERLDR